MKDTENGTKVDEKNSVKSNEWAVLETLTGLLGILCPGEQRYPSAPKRRTTKRPKTKKYPSP